MVVAFSLCADRAVLSAFKPILNYQSLNAKCNGNAFKFSGTMDVRHQRRLCHINATRMSMYDKFVEFGMQQVRQHTKIFPFPVQGEEDQAIPTPPTSDLESLSKSLSRKDLYKEKLRNMSAIDGKATLCTQAVQSSEIRLLRSLIIDGGDAMQVLDFAVFPKPEFDLPIFCANIFSTINMNIVVLDLNPLYDIKYHEKYKEKYYTRLMPLAHKYVELLPWGGKITSESLKFFSPIVIWTKFASSEYKQDVLYSAFTDYLMAWLELMDGAIPETHAVNILNNKEAQHRYLLWRATKDPGHSILTRLLGDSLSEELISHFLFNGALTLGCKRFLDFFPEYRCADGTVNKKRSIAGKLFSKRPWNGDGGFLDI